MTQLGTEGIFSLRLHQDWLWRQLQTSVWKVDFSIGPWKPKLGSFKGRRANYHQACQEGLVKPLAAGSVTATVPPQKRRVRYHRVLFMSSWFWKKDPETLKVSSETVTS